MGIVFELPTANLYKASICVVQRIRNIITRVYIQEILEMKKGWWLAVAIQAVLASLACSARSPSILYLMCDDLRPRLGAYGFKDTFTPNLDALAERSLVFTRAYTQFPFCAPSRNSFLSGRRPDRTKYRDRPGLMLGCGTS
jgi:hypothetical protein